MRDLKRLLRYAIGLLSLALLFNIAGYIYINIQYRENDRQEENEKVASNLQTLSQQVAKDMLYLLVDSSAQNRVLGLNYELWKSLRELETKQAFLRSEIDRPKAQETGALQGLDVLFARVTPFYDSLDSLSRVLLRDTARSDIRAAAAMASIRYNESRYLKGMQDITRIYHNVDDGFVSKIFIANTGLLTSLIFAIIIMAVFVIVPVIKQADKNYKALQYSLEKVRQSEAELTVARDAAEAGIRARSEFMANISHELRTPMNGIIGFSDLLLTTDMQDIQREYVQHVSKSAYSLLSLINDILDFSKIEAGKFFFEHISFNLEDLVGEAVDIVSIKAFEKNIEFICDCQPGVAAFVWGDPLRIRQILINLLGNAIKFTEKGEVTITFIRPEESISKDGKQYLPISIAVKDTGIGIPAEKLATIFESFTQADSSTTRKYGGTGLGLTISKNLAEMMGGTLSVASQSGRGSTFTLQLELEVADEQLVSQQSRLPLHHVLVVDDNPTNCRLLEKFFLHYRIDCDWCAGGESALAKIQTATLEQRPYDLIITDHHMPGMDGITLGEKIRDLAAPEFPPFILMLSSLEKSQQRQQATNAGIDLFLSKPVKLKELHLLIESIFDKTLRRAGNQIQPLEKFEPGTTALVVEDEPVNMMLISEVLRNMGVAVIKATNGEEALGQLANHLPTIIFMDVNMPVMDGYTATHHIRQLSGPQRDIPIVALTADATAGDKEKCLHAGMDTFISKPFRIEEIANVLRRYLSSASPK